MPIRIDANAGNESLSFSNDIRPRASDDVAGAIAGVGKELDNFADGQLARIKVERNKANEQADRVYLAQHASDMRIAWGQELENRLSGYDGSTEGFAQSYMKDYETEADATVAKAPPRVQNQLRYELIQQGDVFNSAAAKAEAGRRQSWAMNTLNATTDKQADALTTQPDLFPSSIAGIAQQAQAAPGDVREKFAKETASKYATAYAQGLVDKDPARLANELEGGELDDYLGPKGKTAWLTAAKGALAKQDATANQAEQARLGAIDDTAKDYVGRTVAYYEAGLAPPDKLVNAAHDWAQKAQNAGLWEKVELARYKFGDKKTEGARSDASAAIADVDQALKLGLTPGQDMVGTAVERVNAAKSPELQEKLQDILSLAGKQREFAMATPQQLNDRYVELTQTGQKAAEPTSATTKELALLERVRAGRDKAIVGKDMVGWAASNGAQVAPIAANDPNLAAAVRARVAVMRPMAAQMGADFQFFGKQERTEFARSLDQMPADQRLGVLATMAAELGPDTGSALHEIAKDAPAEAQAGLLMVAGRSQAAHDVAAGRDALKSNPKIAPSRSSPDVAGAEAEVFGRALPPELGEERNAMGEAARAIYAAGQLRAGHDGKDFDADAYKSALDQAAGGDGHRGGFDKVNGVRTLLPPQLSGDDLQALVKSGALFKDWQTYSYGYPADGKPGGAPAFQDPKTGELHPADPKDLRHVKLIPKGNGLYWLSMTDPAKGPNYLFDYGTAGDKAPRPFVLDLRRAQAPTNYDAYGLYDPAVRSAH